MRHIASDRPARGSAVVETVLIVPVLVVLLLFVVHAGRVASLHHKVDHAAGAAARAASLVSAGRQWNAALAAARADLDEAKVKCRDLSLRLERGTEGGRDVVTARVACTAEGGGLALLKVDRARATGVSTEVIDVFTHRY
jgi:Flp pilus assembly protein TadG